jgi:hypothetical protein
MILINNQQSYHNKIKIKFLKTILMIFMIHFSQKHLINLKFFTRIKHKKYKDRNKKANKIIII